MDILSTLKKRAGRHFLTKVTSARNRKGISFAEARSVMILYLDKDEAYYKKIKRYVKYLKDEHGMRDVMAVAFVNEQEKHLPFYHKHQLELDFFSKSDLNWYWRPQSAVEKFVNKEYDILIDLTFDSSIPMEFVLAESKAKMKVGKKGSPGEKHCDLVFNMEGRDNIDEFLHQVNHYLSNFVLQ